MIHDSFLKKNRETKSPFITNPYRFGSGWDFEDGFSTNMGWTTAGTGNQIDTGNSKLAFRLSRGTSFRGLYIPTNDADVFGDNFSDTAYIIRFHALNFSTTATTYGYSPLLQAQRDGGDHSEATDDALSSWCLVSPQYTNKFGCMANNEATRTNSLETTTWSTGTDYYIENIRNSATEMKSTRSTSDSFDANEHDVTFTIPSSITGLKNITVQSDYGGTGSGRLNIGTIDLIQAMKEVNTAPE